MIAPYPNPLNGDQLTALYLGLLLDERLRERLAAEGAEAVAANAGELDCLETVDLEELDTAARRFRSNIWRLGRGGSLAAAFPCSLRIFAAAGVRDSELLSGFLGSRHFASFRLVPYTGTGLSVEESFASFLLDVAESERARLATAGSDDAAAVRETVLHELMIALFTALACEQPLSFVIGAEGIVTTDRGHAALRHYSPAALALWGEGTARPGATARNQTAGHKPAPAAAAADQAVPYAYFATPAGLACGVVSARVAMAFETAPTPQRDAARGALAQRGLW